MFARGKWMLVNIFLYVLFVVIRSSSKVFGGDNSIITKKT